MGKSTYSIKETKHYRKFTYSGDLKEALEKARKDLQKEKENPDIAYWEWIKKKAVSAILAHERKVERIEAFIMAANKELSERAIKKEKEGAGNGNI